VSLIFDGLNDANKAQSALEPLSSSRAFDSVEAANKNKHIFYGTIGIVVTAAFVFATQAVLSEDSKPAIAVVDKSPVPAAIVIPAPDVVIAIKKQEATPLALIESPPAIALLAPVETPAPKTMTMQIYLPEHEKEHGDVHMAVLAPKRLAPIAIKAIKPIKEKETIALKTAAPVEKEVIVATKTASPMKSIKTGVVTDFSLNTVRTQVGEVKALIASKDYKRARQLIADISQKTGENSFISLRLKGYWHLVQQQNKQAQAYYTKVTDQKPNDIEAGLNLALIELRLGQKASVLDRLKRLGQHHPNSIQIQAFTKKIKKGLNVK